MLMDYHCAIRFSRFEFIVHTHRQTDRQTDRHNHTCYADATTVGVSNYNILYLNNVNRVEKTILDADAVHPQNILNKIHSYYSQIMFMIFITVFIKYFWAMPKASPAVKLRNLLSTVILLAERETNEQTNVTSSGGQNPKCRPTQLL